MIYSLAKPEDALQIAAIHKKEINKGFLSSLSVSFLKNLYSAIICSEASFCIVAKEGGRVVGFISGVTDIKKLYGFFFRKYFFHSAILLSKKFFSFSYLKKIVETLLYPTKEKELPAAELLTMAVLSQFQGRKIASSMLLDFISEMKKRNIDNFKVLVGGELKPAIGFYEKNGFVFLKEIILHDNKNSRIYIYHVT